MTETPEEELLRLEAENAAATEWGAAVGARHERIKALRALVKPSPQPVADAGDVAGLVEELKAFYDRLAHVRNASDMVLVRKAAGALTRQSDQIASLTKERDDWREAHRKLQAEQYEHPWTVNQAAQERQKREAAESRLARLEQEAVKVVGEIAEEAKRSAAYWNAPGPQRSFYRLEDTARAFLDKLRRPS